jgi:cytochrome P450
MVSILDETTGEIRISKFFNPEVTRCPQPMYAELRSKCPVGRAQVTTSPVVSRFEDVAWALRHPEIFSSEMTEQMKLGNPRPMIPQQIDPPAQTRYRRLLDPLFSRKRMLELTPAVRKHANDLIDEFASQGGCEFDQAFAIPLPCTAFLALFGLPISDLPTFLDMKDGIIRPHKFLDPPGPTPEEMSAHIAEQADYRKKTADRMFAYFEDEIAKSRGRHRGDLLGALLTAEVGGEKLTHEEILDICFLLLIAGLDTVTATLGCNIAYLASNPHQRQRIIENPKLIPGAVEELLRWETPVTAVPRVAKCDHTLRDFEIKKGDVVTFLIGSANTDDEHFKSAQEVDFERERNIHLAFGAGPHRCLGSHLARMELQVAMEEWHRRIPEYWIKPGETPTYSPGIREVMYLPLEWEV